MKALELDRHFRRLGAWVDWAKTCDTFKAGSPDTEVKGIAVSWQSTWPALKQALAQDCNLFVTHEPTYYNHWDNDPKFFEYEHARAKREFIEKNGLVIYRCHDVWDIMPRIGVLDSWCRGLGFENPVATRKYYAAFRCQTTLGEPAARVRERTAPIGQSHVLAIGDLRQRVSCVALGTGAITDVPQMAAMGADAALVSDDGSSYWKWGSWAIDRGMALLAVNHATAEEWGIENLSQHIAETFPGVPVRFLPHGCGYQFV